MIERAKTDYITGTLRQNNRNPRKFKRIIYGLIKGSTINVDSNQFVDPDNNLRIPVGDEPNSLNIFFPADLA